MGNEKNEDQTKADYAEAIRLHLWYAPSEFAFDQSKGQKNKALADTFRNAAHKIQADARKEREG
jgi:hypothetical protein